MINKLRLISYLVAGGISIILVCGLFWFFAGIALTLTSISWLFVVGFGLMSFGVSAASFALKRLINPASIIIPTVQRERAGLMFAAGGLVGCTVGLFGVVIFITGIWMLSREY